jgi:hypothetical protein
MEVPIDDVVVGEDDPTENTGNNHNTKRSPSDLVPLAREEFTK